MSKKLAFFLFVFLSVSQMLAQENCRYALVWHDEFNDASLDHSVWSKISKGSSEWRQHMSTDESLYVHDDGQMVLLGKKKDPKSNFSTLQTGGIWTKDKKSFGFGRLEVKAKFDVAQGFWPAIWMLPQAIKGLDWPYGGEIDIMEHFHESPYVDHTVHTNYTYNLGKKWNPPYNCKSNYKEGEFNVYSVEKFQDSLVFGVNGQRTFCYPRYKKGVDGQFPFDKHNFYLILDSQLGEGSRPMIDTASLPVELRIDYVRYYELDTKTDIIPEPKEFAVKSNNAKKIKKIKYRKETFCNPDEYTLTIKRGKVTITGNKAWAQSTLKQLTDENGCARDVEIHDWSAYPFRCFMHDTGRNYQSVDMLKETLDLMSFYKLNYFHWHLTDYPAWRIECRVYPQLNDPQYQRVGRDEGKYYTYEEIHEVIDYARERGITVIPEIDMPGHSTYFTNAFGCTMASLEGRQILEKVFEEFFAEIPQSDCPYIHIGSDEVQIEDPKGFMQWAESVMERYGRKVIAWDPGLPASDKVIRQIWNAAAGSNAAAATKSGKYLDSFMGYLNYYDPMMFTNKIFLHTAAAQAEPDTTKALGGILCLWNDVRVDDKTRISLHNGMINGMMAYSERFWNGGNAGEVEMENLAPGPLTTAGSRLANFEEKMAIHRDRFHKGKMRWVANSQIKWEVQIDENKTYTTYGGAVDLDAFCQLHNIATGETAVAKASTVIFADKEMDIEAWIGFDTPARSNRNGYGIGKQGRWEGNSQCFVNGKEILPPTQWNEPGKYDYHFNTWGRTEEEQPYTDEQFYWMRKPAKVHLKKGENKVEFVVPKTYQGLRWSFAFIPVSTQADGNVKEVKGIRFFDFN